jgi:two-component system, cell cycle sensor histidine kinase and response regulator CckA
MAAPRYVDQTARPIRILLVDDEHAVRIFMERLLTSFGHDVCSVAGAGEALAFLERSDGGTDLVLTDVMMPGMNGCDLGRSVVERWPGLRILFYSGYAAQHLVSDGICTDDMPLLQKPFPPERLEEKIAEVMRRPPYRFGG